eukprot:CAMPEP_0118952482 /NCGR_PEP_ID=MMETSP1169-20130426/54924_1 /TAXON_ID=36882 /ORGANISM="Pyramimonas obovata, Strain CCMP722" /LENGTH=205 /DNA_ID=CAMNT_0006899747 /DNA_START=106 /DNA_END=720 /DNA_ORIENTATION=+
MGGRPEGSRAKSVASWWWVVVGTVLHRAALSSAFGFAPEQTAIDDSSADLYDFDRVSTDVAWAVGSQGAILKTTNALEIGGLTWTAVSSGLQNPTRYVWRTVGTSGTLVWVAGQDGIVIHSSNNGLTWTEQLSSADAAVANWNDIEVVEEGTEVMLVVVGDAGKVMYSNDKGTNWVEKGARRTNGNLYAVKFTSLLNGWAVGADG